MSDPVFRGALAGVKAIDGSVSISAIDDRGMIDLRGDPADKKFAAATKKALGFVLPGEPRTSAGKADVTALWLSPDQWLITCPRGQADVLYTRLVKGLGDIHSLVVNVSDMRTIIRLEGNGAREILMKGAPVDLTTAEYGPGSVRRLRFAELAALIHVISSEPDTIDLYVFRSYGEYTWDWLAATSSKQSELRIFTNQDAAPV